MRRKAVKTFILGFILGIAATILALIYGERDVFFYDL